MASGDFSVKNPVVLSFKALAEEKKVEVLGSDLLPVANAAFACAGAATSVYVLQGIFGKDVIGRFEQLVGIIGGTVIGCKAGCIVFTCSASLAAAFVTAFLVGALAGGVICLITAFRKQIFGAIHNLWTTIMWGVKRCGAAVVEAVQNALAKVVDSMTRAYSTICATLERIEGPLQQMDKEQRDAILEKVQIAVDKAEASIDNAMDEFVQDIEGILAGTDAEGVLEDVKQNTRKAKASNSEAVQQKMKDLKSGTTTQ